MAWKALRQEWKEGRGGGGGSKLLRGGMVGRRMSEGQRERGKEAGWRSDGVINDRVFNTLYGLAYKLRPVHRSSWQRINGLEEQTTGMISLSLSLFALPALLEPSFGVSDLSPRRLLFCGSSLPSFLPSFSSRFPSSRFPIRETELIHQSGNHYSSRSIFVPIKISRRLLPSLPRFASPLQRSTNPPRLRLT